MSEYGNQNPQGRQSGNQSEGAFSFLYRTRIKINKGSVPIINLSLVFSLLTLLCAPWLVIIGGVVALVLGYRFSIGRNEQGFGESWNNVVHHAADNVKNVVNSISTDQPPTMNPMDDTKEP